MKCEHYINLTDENWVSEDEVEVTAECSECLKKFRGRLKIE
jgi:hypothetical protein